MHGTDGRTDGVQHLMRSPREDRITSGMYPGLRPLPEIPSREDLSSYALFFSMNIKL